MKLNDILTAADEAYDHASGGSFSDAGDHLAIFIRLEIISAYQASDGSLRSVIDGLKEAAEEIGDVAEALEGY